MAIKVSSIAKELNRLLVQLNDEGGFTISVLTDSQGLAIAFAGHEGMDPERQSAIVALIQKTISRAGGCLGMKTTDEISIYDSLGQRLVCRPFNVNSHDLILAVTIPNHHTSYRRLTNQTIAAIIRTWDQLAE